TRAHGARPPQRPAPARHAVRTVVSLPAHRRGAGRDGVRVAGHGTPGRDRDSAARLPHRHRGGARRQRNGRARQSPGRRAVRRGRSAHPRARVVTVWNWLAVGGAAVLALVLVAEIRRRAATGPTGRRFFRHPTAAPALFVLAFFVTVALAAPLVIPYRPYFQIDITRLQPRAIGAKPARHRPVRAGRVEPARLWGAHFARHRSARDARRGDHRGRRGRRGGLLPPLGGRDADAARGRRARHAADVHAADGRGPVGA